MVGKVASIIYCAKLGYKIVFTNDGRVEVLECILYNERNTPDDVQNLINTAIPLFVIITLENKS